MMFSSNQVLEISGDLGLDNGSCQLPAALEFALKFSGHLETFNRKDRPAKCVYQITEDGKYCIGWNFNGLEEGWNEFPFDFDIEIISRIIKQHLEKYEIEDSGYDGSHYKGFIMKSIPNYMGSEYDKIKKPFYGIVEFRPYTCFYAK